jgi:predicted RNA-binding Zn ribbon-like protein
MRLEPGRARELRLAGERLCLDFANTLDPRHGAEAAEFLVSYADLASWAGHAGAVGTDRVELLMREARLRPAAAESVLERARELREAVYRCFAAVAAGRRAGAGDLRALQAAYLEALGHARLDAVGRGYVWSWADDSAELEQPLWPVTKSAAELLTAADLGRVRECPGAGACGWLFYDTSRNRSRRWCSMESCGNRAKGRRHYRRTRAAAE